MAERKIVLEGEPLSTQHIYGRGRFGGGTYMTAKGKATKHTYQWEAKTQWSGKPIAGPLTMAVHFYFKNFRRRDLDNQNKIVLDALTGIVYDDDHQIDELHLYRKHDAENPRIEVRV